jgi:hypothetical protein
MAVSSLANICKGKILSSDVLIAKYVRLYGVCMCLVRKISSSFENTAGREYSPVIGFCEHDDESR